MYVLHVHDDGTLGHWYIGTLVRWDYTFFVTKYSTNKPSQTYKRSIRINMYMKTDGTLGPWYVTKKCLLTWYVGKLIRLYVTKSAPLIFRLINLIIAEYILRLSNNSEFSYHIYE